MRLCICFAPAYQKRVYKKKPFLPCPERDNFTSVGTMKGQGIVRGVVVIVFLMLLPPYRCFLKAVCSVYHGIIATEKRLSNRFKI